MSEIVQNLDASNSVWDEFERAKPSNPYNYTEGQLAKREITLKALARDFPTLPRKWLEWSHDAIENKSPEEQQAIIEAQVQIRWWRHITSFLILMTQ